jgi:hypothetical protein
MEMKKPLADDIVVKAYRDIGGRQEVSMNDVLSAVGIASGAQLAQLIQLIVHAAAQAGFGVNMETLSLITKDSTLLQLRNFVLAALSTPKKCKDGHPVGAGQSSCAYGHPAEG